MNILSILGFVFLLASLSVSFIQDQRLPDEDEIGSVRHRKVPSIDDDEDQLLPEPTTTTKKSTSIIIPDFGLKQQILKQAAPAPPPPVPLPPPSREEDVDDDDNDKDEKMIPRRQADADATKPPFYCNASDPRNKYPENYTRYDCICKTGAECWDQVYFQCNSTTGRCDCNAHMDYTKILVGPFKGKLWCLVRKRENCVPRETQHEDCQTGRCNRFKQCATLSVHSNVTSGVTMKIPRRVMLIITILQYIPLL